MFFRLVGVEESFLSLREDVFNAQVLADIGFVEQYRRVHFTLAALQRTLRGDTKANRNVGHVEHGDALVLWRVLGDSSQPCARDVMAVHETLFLRRLHPELKERKLRNLLERRDLDSNVPVMRQLGNQNTDAHEIFRSDAARELRETLRHVPNSVVVKPEAPGLIAALKQMLRVAPHVLR